MPLLLLAMQLGMVQFEVDASRSTIAVKTDKGGLLSAFAGHRHGILAGEFTPRVCAVPGTLDNAAVSVRVETSSLRIDTPEARRAAGLSGSGPSQEEVQEIRRKMLSAANLDAGAHPAIVFESTRASRTGDVITLRGPLTIRGRTNEVAVPLRVARAGDAYRFTGGFRIRLTGYGIRPESVAGVVKVADEVEILLDLVARSSDKRCEQ
jgi:polyisoprenoid-binding protein YceI